METVWPEEFPVLTTDRVLLRRVSKKDSEGIYRCFSDPETMRYMGAPLDDPHSIAGIVKEYSNGLKEGRSLIWSLEHRPSGEFLGTAGFEEFSFLDVKAEAGFTLLGSYRGKGYMTEAMSAILTFGFREVGLNRVEAMIHPENTAAVKLVETLGFLKEGRLRKSVFFNGNFHDQMVFSLLREERNG